MFGLKFGKLFSLVDKLHFHPLFLPFYSPLQSCPWQHEQVKQRFTLISYLMQSYL